MEVKWTPGPWTTDGIYVDAVTPRRTTGICSCRDTPHHETRSNAHLIAAAPDLYAALHAVMLEFGPGTMSEKAFAHATAALAKARGEQ